MVPISCLARSATMAESPCCEVVWAEYKLAIGGVMAMQFKDEFFVPRKGRVVLFGKSTGGCTFAVC